MGVNQFHLIFNEITCEGSTLTSEKPKISFSCGFHIGIPHKPCVYAVFPYPNQFYGRNKIPAVLLFSGYCYHDFQDNTEVKDPLLARS